MRTDREAQGKAGGLWERQGAWVGEFLCYFWEDRGTLGKNRGLGWGIPMQFWEDRGTLGKNRGLGWGIPMQFWASLRG